jgi:hypothetical protein
MWPWRVAWVVWAPPAASGILIMMGSNDNCCGFAAGAPQLMHSATAPPEEAVLERTVDVVPYHDRFSMTLMRVIDRVSSLRTTTCRHCQIHQYL